MRIIYKKDHKSIAKFESFELPPLVILTGTNGSGKTHFMQAIRNGSVLVNEIERGQIAYFNYHDFFVSNETASTTQQIESEKQGAWQNFEQAKRRGGLKHELAQLRNKLGLNYERVLKLARGKPFLHLGREDFQDQEDLYNDYMEYVRKITDYLGKLKNRSMAISLERISDFYDRAVDEVTERMFKDYYRTSSSKQGLLPHQLSRVFLEYNYRKYRDLVIRTAESDYYQESSDIKNELQYEQVHGPKPWSLLRELLDQFGSFSYEINDPDSIKIRHDSIATFQLKLIDRERDVWSDPNKPDKITLVR